MTNNNGSKGKTLVIGTHNGEFHPDDLFAVAACLLRHPGSKVVRSRDPEVLAKCDILIDVGDRYSPNEGRFDHHQAGGAGERENGVKYSSFGLYWLESGRDICQGNTAIAETVDKRLVQVIDAGDNGQALHKEECFPGVVQRDVGENLFNFNPQWDEEDKDFDAAFMRSIPFAQAVILRDFAKARAEYRAGEIVRGAIASAEDPRIIALDMAAPWDAIVINEAPQALYVVFPAADGDWYVQCVPPAVGSFAQRKPLPEAWSAKRGDELAELTGVKDSVFCHRFRFIGGAKSKKGALELAKLAADQG